jgi:cytochrome c553
MSAGRGFDWGDKWVVGSIALTAGIFVVSAIAGLIALPSLQAAPGGASLWDTICAAAGLTRPAPKAATAIQPDYRVSAVVMTSDMLRHPSPQSIGHGATIAQECAICHGPTGVSRADAPNLAGQYAAAIYKQLMDFHAGARINSTMSPFAANLSDQDMQDVAVYYAYLPRLPGYHPNLKPSEPRIVIYGAPLRGVAPCGSCHGALDNKVGSPWLEGQPAAYVKAQLQAFQSGARRNDLGQQMRNIARKLTAEEIDQIAAYYSSQPATAGVR